MTVNDAEEMFREKVLNGIATNDDSRRELARRIKSARAVSVFNDRQRRYRKAANECRKSGRYARLFGIGKAANGAGVPR